MTTSLLAFVVGVSLASVYLAILIAARPSLMRRTFFWGSASVACWLTASLLPLLRPRSWSIFGAGAPFGGILAQMSHAITLIAVANAIVALVVASRARIHVPLAGLSIGPLYVLSGAKILGGFWSGHGLIYTQLWFTLAIHSMALAWIDNPATCRTFIRAITRTATSVSLISAIMLPSWSLMPGTARVLSVDRLAGVMPHPNAMALLACAAIVIEWVGAPSRARGAFVCVAVGCVVWAQSDTGFLAASIALVMIMLGRSGASRPLLASMLSLAAVSFAVYSPIGVELRDFVGESRLTTLSGRVEIWSVAQAEHVLHPWFGLGDYFLSEEYRRLYLPLNMQQASNAHSQWFQTLGESGTIGSIALVLFASVVLFRAVRVRTQDGWVSLAIVAVLFTFSVTEVPLRSAGISALTALVLIPVLLSRARTSGSNARNTRAASEESDARVALSGGRLDL